MEQIEAWKDEEESDKIQNLIDIGSIYQNRNILDMIVREVTLHDSINNSSQYTENFSCNDQDNHEDAKFFSLDELANLNIDSSHDEIDEN